MPYSMRNQRHTHGETKWSKEKSVLMEDNNIVEYTKEQCLYALKRSIEECRVLNGVLIGTEVAIGIYNYLSDNEKLQIRRKEE